MDLNQTKTADSADVVLMHPASGEPLGDKGPDGTVANPATITVAGKDSDTYRTFQRRLLNRRLAVKGRRDSTPTVEELEEEGLSLLVTCTLGWKNIELDGKALAFSPGAARQLYSDFPWIREQVDAAIGDRERFLSN